MTLIWNTECGSGQVRKKGGRPVVLIWKKVLGFTAEAIHFVMSLRHKVMLRVEVGMGREKECYDEIVKLGYPIYVIKALNRMMVRVKKKKIDSCSIPPYQIIPIRMLFWFYTEILEDTTGS